MKVLVIGASGYVGGGAARALRTAGHEVTGAARSDEARETLTSAGYGVVRADVGDPASLIDVARASDAVVYAVQVNQRDAEQVNSAALRSLVDALADTTKALLFTSGVWYYGPTGDRIADEQTPPDPSPSMASRARLEAIVLEGTNRGVRSVVIRPGNVFGEGRGLPAMYVQWAREGTARTIGNGSNRWSVVNLDDLGRQYALALERARPGDVFNATDETTFTQLEVAQAASRGARQDVAPTVWPVEEASVALGPWVAFLAMDQRVTSTRARSRLGWATQAPTIVEDLERGSYVLPQ
ncbi:MAG TPA: NAD-dependent epimerase/dehydratase family protein [Candidatus Cybelea sp.]|jgi:nucleoside-diphosphate-sugar epimerase|nr:NAD-dependent epimerase/dehydratase family protein [Candidatus Cybelea sp.]